MLGVCRWGAFLRKGKKMKTTNQFIKPCNYGIDCEPVFYGNRIATLQQAMKGICSVYVTGSGILTFDGSLPQYHSQLNEVVRAAKWASITQPVLLHTKPCSGVMLWNSHVVGRLGLSDMGLTLQSRGKLPA